MHKVVVRRLAAGFVALAAALVCFAPHPAHALDKQGSAHAGAVDGGDEGFDVSGDVALGVALRNPSYAARPDNTGRALFRYALHADIDLLGRLLSIPIDVNTFTDRERKGALELAPTELDLIAGLTTTFALGPGALEIGARGETDRCCLSRYSAAYVSRSVVTARHRSFALRDHLRWRERRRKQGRRGAARRARDPGVVVIAV